MEFTNEELGIMAWGIQKQIKNKDYMDEEDKQQLMDICKKIGFKLKINNMIECEELRVKIEVEDRKREKERKERVRKEELEELKEVEMCCGDGEVCNRCK